MSNSGTVRITKELFHLKKSSDLSLAVEFSEDNIRHCHALVIGPAETPYEFGFFIFRIRFGRDYPQSPPDVELLTTNNGLTRFNPNMYSDGKVCLSILGTWRGEAGEEWSSAQGLESLLISIQSLMSSNPFENEPGFETAKRDSDKKDALAYIAKIRHETLKVAVIEPLERWLGMEGPLRVETEERRGPNGVDYRRPNALAETDFEEDYYWFFDLCKRRFLWHYDSYLRSIETELAKEGTKTGTRFRIMPFEHEHNEMKGAFDYPSLRTRLQAIRAAIDQETERWIEQSLEAVKNESPTTLSFQNRFKHLKQHYSISGTPVDLELVDDNPFQWRLILFGRPMTNLDGGIFKIKITVSIWFPREHPRVVVETPIFHHRVSSEGVLCYVPAKGDEIESHVAAIIAAIEDETPPYDPRQIGNADAAKLLWGSAEEKKQYNRKLRRSAQDSSE